MPVSKPALRFSLEQARGLAVAAQGFPPVSGRSLVQVEETGFVSTVGGVDIYLAVRARVPGMTRDDLEGVVEVHDAPRPLLASCSNSRGALP